jgi:hypothetical protein
LETAIVDAGLERKVAEKKSVQLIKELQQQLSKLQNGTASPKPQRASVSASASLISSTTTSRSPRGGDLGKSKVDMQVFCVLLLLLGFCEITKHVLKGATRGKQSVDPSYFCYARAAMES